VTLPFPTCKCPTPRHYDYENEVIELGEDYAIKRHRVECKTCGAVATGEPQRWGRGLRAVDSWVKGG
jgi:hypothetical protein